MLLYTRKGTARVRRLYEGQGQGQVTRGNKKQKSQACRVTQVFRVFLHADIDSDGHLTL